VRKLAYIGMYEESGILAEEFAKLGYHCFCLDNDFTEAGYRSPSPRIEYITIDLSDREETDKFMLKVLKNYDIAFLAGFPPCTDLASSGAGHWAKKAKKNPDFQKDAMDLVFTVPELGELLGCPWFLENPIGKVSTFWRKPDFKFHPFQYSGFHEDDCYSKTTCLWTGNGFVMPKEFIADSCDVPKSGFVENKAKKHRRRMRSKTPKGFSKAVALANIRR
jgi:hypothetical protein